MLNFRGVPLNLSRPFKNVWVPSTIRVRHFGTHGHGSFTDSYKEMHKDNFPLDLMPYDPGDQLVVDELLLH
jgi:hypothetical protein